MILQGIGMGSLLDLFVMFGRVYLTYLIVIYICMIYALQCQT
jgi:hypothetical protein